MRLEDERMTSLSVDEKKRFLRALEEDEEFRYAVAGKLGILEVLKRLDRIEEELRKLWMKSLEHDKRFKAIEKKLLEHDKRFEEINKRFEAIEKKLLEHDKRLEAIEKKLLEHDKRFEAIERKLLEHDKRFEAIEKKLLDHDEKFKQIHKEVLTLRAQVGGFTSRAGRGIERLILEVYRDVLKQKGIQAEKVEKISIKDVDGRWLRRGARIELDIYIHNQDVWFIEVKSLVEPDDVEWFQTRCEIMEKVLGKKPTRKLIIAIDIFKEALERARELGIDVVYTNVHEVKK